MTITPAQLVEALDGALPGFASYRAGPETLFDGQSLCAVFSSCTEYVQEHAVSEPQWNALAVVLNAMAASKDATLSEAACTCFLENLAERDHPLSSRLTGFALTYWRHWSQP